MMKKHLFYGKPLDHTNVMEECFDVMWYVSLCLDAAGFTMEQAMERGLAKLQARYPNGFTEEAALCRNLTAERRELEQPETPPSQDRIMRLFAAQVARALVIERIKRIEKYELPDNFNVGVEIVPGRTTSKSYTANLRIDDVSATVTINTADEAADMAVATAQLVAIWLNQHVVKQPLYANPA